MTVKELICMLVNSGVDMDATILLTTDPLEGDTHTLFELENMIIDPKLSTPSLYFKDWRRYRPDEYRIEYIGEQKWDENGVRIPKGD